MFEVDQFVADCRAAFVEDQTHKAVREILARAVSHPAAVLKGRGEPKCAEVRTLFHSPSLTILNVVWGTDDDGNAPQSSHVGRHRYLFGSGGQHLLAACWGDAEQDRGGWCQSTVRGGR
jgi:hypothetical protein